MKVTPVKDAYDAQFVGKCDGSNWIQIAYNDQDRDPWKWPKIMQCGDTYYRWMSYNSDRCVINYKECAKSEIAFKVNSVRP